MNEFLKNFRNSQKRYSGNKRNQYDGHYYPAQDRRNGNERRNEQPQQQQQQQAKPADMLSSKLDEFIPVLQTLLENITEKQQHIVELKERQTKSGELMAEAFKDIARALNNQGTQNTAQMPVAQDETGKQTETFSAADLDKEEMKSSADEKKEVIKIMKKLRKKGGTYKEIANFLNEKKTPTFSNKGYWHAQTIHRLCSR